MSCIDDDDLDPVLSTEAYMYPIHQIEESLPPTDVSLPLIEKSLLPIDENLLSAEENHVELTTAVGKDQYDWWMPVKPPDHRVLTRKFDNKSYYKCPFLDVNIRVARKITV